MSKWQELRDESVREANRVKGKTKNQEKYLRAMETSTVTICVGVAGTGKTYLACGLAAQMLREGRIQKIVLTRPIVSCGKGYGYRPGTAHEKVVPVMRPMLEALGDFFSNRELAKFLDDEVVELWPLDDMRGASIRDAFIVADEMQNAEYNQLHMLLTRFGEGTRLVVTGDPTPTQTDLVHRGVNPLRKVISRFSRDCHPDVSIVRLFHEDIVRHPLLRWIDERLNGSAVLEAECPSCRKKFFFESWVELASCCHCDARLELFDGDGCLYPAVSHALDGFACTLKERP